MRDIRFEKGVPSDSCVQVQQLQTILRPFLLRRMKEDVEKAIPPKVRMIVSV